MFVTRLLLYTPITANQVTILGAAVYVGGAVLFITGTSLMVLVGALVVRASIVLDYVDGNVARYRGTSSPEGDFVDRLSDCIPQVFFFIFLSIGMYRNYPHLLTLCIGFLAVMSILLSTLIEVCQDAALLKAILQERTESGKTFAPPQQTSSTGGSFVARVFSMPEEAISSLSASLHYPYHTVDLFIAAAGLDLVLQKGFPAISLPFSIVLAVFTVYSLLSLVSAIARISHIVQARHIQSLYASVSATLTESNKTTREPNSASESPRSDG